MQPTTFFDRETMLERLGGDAELLSEIVALFVEECPNMIGSVRDSIAEQDADQVERAAHTLKGALLNIAADPVAETAKRLEILGRSGELADTAEVLASLEAELDHLVQELSGLD